MKRRNAAAILVAFAILSTTSPAFAADSAAEPAPPSGGGTRLASAPPGATTGQTPGISRPSQYIEASSLADARTKLAAVESQGSTATPQAAAAAANVQYGPCTLYPSVLYLRKSSNYGAVGTKPYTQCSTAVTSIKHTTDLVYQWYLWWPQAGVYKGGNSGASSYTQKNVEYTCVGTTRTTWGGTTLGTIAYGGKTYYARVYQNTASLKCEA